MDESVRLLVQVNECAWTRFKKDLEGVTPEEANWRPMPEANSINLILRHVRIDAPWHVASAERSDEHATQEPSGTQVVADPVALDLDGNLRHLEESCTRFIAGLRAMTLAELQRRSLVAYRDAPQGLPPDCLLGFHLALHLAAHGGQIRTLRNLYRKARGQRARFFPDNPTFPTTEDG